MFRISMLVAIALVQATMGCALLAFRPSFAQEGSPSRPAAAASSPSRPKEPASEKAVPSTKAKKAWSEKGTIGESDTPPTRSPAAAQKPIPTDERATACFERALDRFPWPTVPRPTNQRVIVKDYLKPTDPSEGAGAHPLAGQVLHDGQTLGQLLVILRHRLAMAGYPVPPVIGAGCNGFALILEGERVRLDGTRIGFEQWNQGKRLGLIEILEKLMQGQPGFFRMMVLVASNERPIGGGAPIDADELRRLLMLGASGLPVGMQDIPFDEKYELYALVYEFETGTNASAAQVAPAGRIPMLSHLRATGLVAAK